MLNTKKKNRKGKQRKLSPSCVTMMLMHIVIKLIKSVLA